MTRQVYSDEERNCHVIIYVHTSEIDGEVLYDRTQTSIVTWSILGHYKPTCPTNECGGDVDVMMDVWQI